MPILLDFIPGKAKRSSAPEDPRKRQDVGARPRHHRWRVTRCKSKGFMATLPRSQQLLVLAEYGRTGKVHGWMGNYWKRRERLLLVDRKLQLEEFKARPIWQSRSRPRTTPERLLQIPFRALRFRETAKQPMTRW